jgi:hypothetical protein
MALAIVVLLMTGAALAQDEDFPIEVVLTSFSETTGDIECDVYSHSDTPIVAFEIKVIIRLIDGNEFVMSSAWDYWKGGKEEYFHKGGSTKHLSNVSSYMKFGELADPPIEVVAACIIFEDGRSIGNKESIEIIYQLRAGAITEFCRISELYNDLARNSSTRGLRDLIQTAIVSVEDGDLVLARNQLDTPPVWQSDPGFQMFRFGLSGVRGVSIDFLNSLAESLEPPSGTAIQKAVSRLRYEADKYGRYCSEAEFHLRQSDLNLVHLAIKDPSERELQ